MELARERAAFVAERAKLHKELQEASARTRKANLQSGGSQGLQCLLSAALPGPCGVACRAQGTRDGTCTGAPSCGRRRARSSSGWAGALTRARAVTMASLPHDRVRAFGCSSPMAVSTRPRPRDTRKTTAHLRITRSKFEKCAAHILEDPYFTVGRFLQRQLGETCSFYDTGAYDADKKFLRVRTEVSCLPDRILSVDKKMERIQKTVQSEMNRWFKRGNIGQVLIDREATGLTLGRPSTSRSMTAMSRS